MAFDITGKLIEISPVVQVSEKFRKREFVIERKESAGGTVFVEYIKFQLVQDKCDSISDNLLHDDIRVHFNIKGNRWERDGKVSYFTNLDAWRIERVTGGQTESVEPPPFPLEESPPPENEEFDSLPF